MPFTDEERRRWYENKRQREKRAPSNWETARGQAVAVCVHCGNPFGIGKGVITEDAAFCDVCND